MFKGVYTALITPFNEDDSIDLHSLENLIEWQIQQGINGIVINGTTAESPNLSYEERKSIIKKAIDVVSKRVPIIVGTGSNSTLVTLQLTEQAQKLGADAALIITPYYNKPSQEGIFQHFKEVNDKSNLPIILYNAPGRTVISIDCDTIGRLSKLKNIVGIKDCKGSYRPLEMRKFIDDDFSVLSGDDPDTIAFYANGGGGSVSVVSNVIPNEMVKIHKLLSENKFKEARENFARYTDLISVMFCDTNPVPVKYALSKMGKCKSKLRLPLVELNSENIGRVNKVLDDLNII